MRAHGTRPRGFTLIELLISLSIVGILVLIITGTLRAGLSSVEKGEEKFDELERLRASISIIDSQIQSWLPVTREDEGGEKKFSFTGEREALAFHSNFSIMDGRQGYLSVAYRAVRDDSGKVSLVASEQLIGKMGGMEFVLLKGFDDIYFTYLFRDREMDIVEWVEEWNNYEYMPEAVLLIAMDGGRVLPLLVPVRTLKPPLAAKKARRGR